MRVALKNGLLLSAFLLLAPPAWAQDSSPEDPKTKAEGAKTKARSSRRSRRYEREMRALRSRLETLEKQVKSEKEASQEDPSKAENDKKSMDGNQGGITEAIGNVILGRSRRLTLSGQMRLRGQYQNNRSDFESDDSDESESILSRIRLRFDFSMLDDLDVVLELQDSRSFGSTNNVVSTGRELESTDVSLGYLEARNFLTKGLTLRAGRQILAFGDQLLVGRRRFNNFAIRFDAFSLIYTLPDSSRPMFKPKRPPLFKIHSFFSVLNETTTNSDDSFFTGAHMTIGRILPGGVMDFYYYLLNNQDERATTGENGLTGNRHVHTVGSRWTSKIGDLSGKIEYAQQLGENADDDIRDTFFFSGSLSYTLSKVNWKPTFGVLYYFATGDRDPTDNKTNTFDRLFGNNGPLGYSRLFSLKNLDNLVLRLSISPSKKCSLKFDYRFYRLEDTKDFHFTAPARPVRPDLSPRFGPRRDASKTLGHEIDVSVKYKVNKYIVVVTQVGHFLPGGFYRQAGAKSAATLAYIHLIANF
jgi:hypothetical protein